MQHIIWIISAILILNVLGLVFKEMYSEKRNSFNSNVIRPKKIFFIVGSVGTVVMLSGIIFCWFLETSSSDLEKYIYSALIVLFTILLGGYLILFYLNYKITLNGDSFTFQNFWHVKRTIYYKDIEINKTKLYPQVRIKKPNGKTKLIFKLAGVLDNEDAFMKSYKDWKNKSNSKKSEHFHTF